LAINARDVMPEGGELIIETKNVELDDEYASTHAGVSAGQFVLLCVSDSGQGMSAEVQRRIFEPFFTTKEPGKGTGLGLAVVHGIVKQSDGHINVYSEVGVGTSLKIYLPAVEPLRDVGAEPSARPAIARGTGTILLVEDEDGVRMLGQRALTRSGYTVLVARGPTDAIEISRAHAGPIDLLLTDVVMPEMNGRRLAEVLAPDRPSMKVLYMSGYTDDAIMRQGVLHAGVNFLHKPFVPSALVTKVQDALDGRDERDSTRGA
jgi:two-component system, cell cycle sensor histidine kinase and response regulator CckA